MVRSSIQPQSAAPTSLRLPGDATTCCFWHSPPAGLRCAASAPKTAGSPRGLFCTGCTVLRSRGVAAAVSMRRCGPALSAQARDLDAWSAAAIAQAVAGLSGAAGDDGQQNSRRLTAGGVTPSFQCRMLPSQATLSEAAPEISSAGLPACPSLTRLAVGFAHDCMPSADPCTNPRPLTPRRRPSQSPHRL